MIDERTRSAGGIAPGEQHTVQVSDQGASVSALVRYEQHSTRSSGFHYTTEVQVEAPQSPVSLHIRPQTDAEARDVAAGRALDLTTGDDDLDRAFVVEGAPADAIALWLDEEIRARLRAAGRVWVKLGAAKLEVLRDGWWPEHEQALAELAGIMVLRLPGAVARAKQAYVAARSGYRGDPDGQLGKERADKWRGELLSLAEVLEARQRRRRVGVVLLVLGVLVAVLVLGALAGLISR